jgi:saccharopine dehydrogenase-like NADP-dependent oxidoreductase
MTTITLLGGAGLMGSGIVRDLISDLAICEFKLLRVCDASPERMAALLAALDDPRLEAHRFDAAQPEQLRTLIQGADLCINAVPTLAGFQMSIFEAALAARVPYMDLGGLGVFTVEQKGWHQRFVDAGVTAVVGTGGDPGLSNVLCRAVADELDRIDSIRLYWAAETVGPENPALVPPYSVSTVLAEYARPSTQFLNGRHVECAPMTGVEVLDLPEPFGETEFMYSPHSEPLTVPLAQGIGDKGIRDFTWKLHLPHREHEAWVGLVKAGFGDFDDPVQVDGRAVKPLDVLNAVIERNIERNRQRMPEQENHEIHFAIGVGQRKGAPATVRCEVLVRPDDRYAHYVDATTSMNASIAAQLMLTSEAMPGVWAPEEFFDVKRYFVELDRRGFQVLTEIN